VDFSVVAIAFLTKNIKIVVAIVLHMGYGGVFGRCVALIGRKESGL
jgi:hypothetical protein